MTHDHVVYEYMGAECSKLRQPMRAIFALSRAQLLFLVVTRSRELSRECHVTKHKTPARSNFPLSNFENSGPFNSAHRALQVEGCAPKILKKGRTLIAISGSSTYIIWYKGYYITIVIPGKGTYIATCGD